MTQNPIVKALREHDYFMAGEICADEIERLESEKAPLLKELKDLVRRARNSGHGTSRAEAAIAKAK